MARGFQAQARRGHPGHTCDTSLSAHTSSDQARPDVHSALLTSMSATCSALRLPTATAGSVRHAQSSQGVAAPVRRQRHQQPLLARQCRAAAGGGDASGSQDVGAEFLKQYKTLAADIMASAKPVSTSGSAAGKEEGGSGCCGGSGASEEKEVGAGCLEPCDWRMLCAVRVPCAAHVAVKSAPLESSPHS